MTKSNQIKRLAPLVLASAGALASGNVGAASVDVTNYYDSSNVNRLEISGTESEVGRYVGSLNFSDFFNADFKPSDIISITGDLAFPNFPITNSLYVGDFNNDKVLSTSILYNSINDLLNSSGNLRTQTQDLNNRNDLFFDSNYRVNNVNLEAPKTVPTPGSLPLLLSGLAGLGFAKKKGRIKGSASLKRIKGSASLKKKIIWKIIKNLQWENGFGGCFTRYFSWGVRGWTYCFYG